MDTTEADRQITKYGDGGRYDCTNTDLGYNVITYP
jgi:hypothetical protein